MPATALTCIASNQAQGYRERGEETQMSVAVRTSKKARAQRSHWVTAIHEAGHAVLSLHFELDPQTISIRPSRGVRGYCATAGWSAGENRHPGLVAVRRAISAYAGAEAVRQLCSRADVDATDGAGDDFERAAAYCEHDEARMTRAQRQCVKLVKHYAPEIREVARSLFASRRGELSSERAYELVQGSLAKRCADWARHN